MHYGIILPIYIYDAQRLSLVQPAINSLSTTVNDGNKPTLLVLWKQASYRMPSNIMLDTKFNFYVEPDPLDVSGSEQTLAYGTQVLFDKHKCDYVTWMGDDALFHPEWHMKLRTLIKDKPEAKGWSVYRSAYEQYHKTLKEDNGYVLVSTLCGHGMTINHQEWNDWGIDYKTQDWGSPSGNTMDLHHAWKREGERWTTAVSYVDHTGRTGLHCTPNLPEWAVNFQGTE